MIRLLVELFAAALIETLTILGLLLSWLPGILRSVVLVLRFVLSTSCWLFRSVAEFVGRPLLRLRFNLTRQPWRSLFAVLLSVGSGAAICFAIGVPFSQRIQIACIVYGLIVAFTWDQMQPPNGISIGR